MIITILTSLHGCKSNKLHLPIISLNNALVVIFLYFVNIPSLPPVVDDENWKKNNSAELSMIYSIIGQYNGGINLVINPDAI